MIKIEYEKMNLSIEVESAKISKEPSNIHTATESDEKDDITIFYVRNNKNKYNIKI